MARRIVVADLMNEPVVIVMRDGSEWTVDTIGVYDMQRLFLAEAEAFTEDGEDLSPVESMGRVARAADLCFELIGRDNPEFDPEPHRTSMQPQVVMAMLGSLVGNDSIAAAVRETLSPDPEDAETGDATSGASDAPEDVTDAEGAGDDPLRSTRPSPTPSSESDSISAGDLNGGSPPAAPGEPSAPTSETFDEPVVAAV
jgi:hypothetical protein